MSVRETSDGGAGGETETETETKTETETETGRHDSRLEALVDYLTTGRVYLVTLFATVELVLVAFSLVVEFGFGATIIAALFAAAALLLLIVAVASVVVVAIARRVLTSV